MSNPRREMGNPRDSRESKCRGGAGEFAQAAPPPGCCLHVELRIVGGVLPQKAEMIQMNKEEQDPFRRLLGVLGTQDVCHRATKFLRQTLLRTGRPTGGSPRGSL